MKRTGWLSSDAAWRKDVRSTLDRVRRLVPGIPPSAIPDFVQSVFGKWQRLGLVKRFVVVSTAVVLLGMLTIGFWVSTKIEDGVTRYTAVTAALYVDGLIAPLAQDLRHRDEISKQNADKIDAIIQAQRQSGTQLVAVKLWKQNGVIAYSTWKDLIGKKLKPTEHLKNAWQGNVSAEYDHVVHEDSSVERSGGGRLLEVYAPVFSSEDGRVIAVSEFYFAADMLGDELAAATTQSWLVVGLTTLAIVLALFGLVLNASSTIERQNTAMQRQIGSLRKLVDQNRELRKRIQRAYVRSTQRNERLLRRLGSELHDGPAQLLGLALLRLDSLFKKPKGASGDRETADKPPADLEIVRGALQDSMREIRNLSSGFALPQLDRMNLAEVVQLVVRNHEKRTSTKVDLQFATGIADVSNTAKECIYRFLQEALNNSFRHAMGVQQKVEVFDDDANLIVRASDGGPGLQDDFAPAPDGGLGLPGLRDRVEALDGSLLITSAASQGTMLTASFDPGKISMREDGDD